MGKKKGYHFTVADYESLGYHFCDTLLDYCDPDNTKYANVLGNLENRMKLEILARFGQDPTNATDMHLSDYASDIESSDGGSDSSVSDGPPLHLQYNLERPQKKKKKLKTRKDRDRVRQAPPPEDVKKPASSTQTEEKPVRAEASKTDKVGTAHAASGKTHDKVGNSLPLQVCPGAVQCVRWISNPVWHDGEADRLDVTLAFLHILKVEFHRLGKPM
ncbi:hypothetical protein ACOMHN_026473 [Nucella lapillus]